MAGPSFSNPQSANDLYNMQTGEPAPSGGGGGGDYIAALINLGSTIYASETARNNSKRTIKANKELAEYSYSKDLEMWNRMNQYNDPSQVMARLGKAGLNPNMVYGSGSASGGNATTMPKYNAPTVDYNYMPPNIGGVLEAYQNFQMRQAQIDNVKAQTQNTMSRTTNEAIRGTLIGNQADSTAEKTSYNRRTRDYQASILESQTRSSAAQAQSAFQKLALMNQEEQMRNLQMSYLRNNISQQSIDAERKQANLIFEKQKAEWSKAGVTTGDHPLLRILVRMMNESGFK